MKTLLFCTLLLFSTSGIMTHKPAVPVEVKTAFSRMHPDIEQPFWEIRSEAFVATFRDAEGFKKVFFGKDGQWQETRLRLTQNQLPGAVQAFIRTHYADADVTYTGRVTGPSATLYRVESELPRSIVVKLLDEKGTLRQEEVIPLDISLQEKNQADLAPLPGLRAMPARARQ